MTIQKQDAAEEIAWNAGAIGYCPIHFKTWKGTGDVEASMGYWEENPNDYDGTFSSEKDAKKHIEDVILAATGKSECVECAQNSHTKLVRPQ